AGVGGGEVRRLRERHVAREAGQPARTDQFEGQVTLVGLRRLRRGRVVPAAEVAKPLLDSRTEEGVARLRDQARDEQKVAAHLHLLDALGAVDARATEGAAR